MVIKWLTLHNCILSPHVCIAVTMKTKYCYTRHRTPFHLTSGRPAPRMFSSTLQSGPNAFPLYLPTATLELSFWPSTGRIPNFYDCQLFVTITRRIKCVLWSLQWLLWCLPTPCPRWRHTLLIQVWQEEGCRTSIKEGAADWIISDGPHNLAASNFISMWDYMIHHIHNTIQQTCTTTTVDSNLLHWHLQRMNYTVPNVIHKINVNT